jgi:phosphatidylserine/phosphatidylglycerophosphate/cardiolipin synthase-like enzyme
MPREEVKLHLSSGDIKILATIPTEYTYSSAIPDNFVAPYAGSLVSYVADLIDGAQEELVIVMPYWSILGVDVIKGRMSGKSKSGLSITLMTPRPEEMKADDCQGVAAFRQFMAQAGATVEHLAPNELSSGIRPLVHGKVVVADKKVAYLGSANLSKNGLNQSIEAGVALSGSEAMRLRNWFMSLTVHFHEVA